MGALGADRAPLAWSMNVGFRLRIVFFSSLVGRSESNLTPRGLLFQTRRIPTSEISSRVPVLNALPEPIDPVIDSRPRSEKSQRRSERRPRSAHAKTGSTSSSCFAFLNRTVDYARCPSGRRAIILKLSSMWTRRFKARTKAVLPIAYLECSTISKPLSCKTASIRRSLSPM
jgi:hypothetical protein